jgi:RNA polymerase sigma-70 factor, ECF subfamily
VNADDETLAAAAAAGNRDAFDTLVRRHQSRIYGLVRILTRGADEAEDLAQEVFVRAFRGIGRFRGDSTFTTWLHRIAVNVVRSHGARRHLVMRVRARHEDDEPALDRVPSAEDLESAVIRRRMIDQALATLSDDARVAVTLRDVQGLEYHEIALIVGVPIGTIESRISRARRRLRPLLAPLLGRSGDRIDGSRRRR